MYKITAEMIPNRDSFTARDVYIPYKKVRQLNNQPYSSKMVFCEILSLFFMFIRDRILEGRTVELPGDMGELSINGIKPRIKTDSEGRPKLPPDWGETKKLWLENEEARKNRQILFHFNDHSGFVRYKIFWKRKFIANIDNLIYYSFMGARKFSREVAQNIFKGVEYNQRQLKYIHNAD